MATTFLNMGLNTADDRSLLEPGELQVATGAYYKPGDTRRVWKILGRTTYGDAYTTASSAIGLLYCAFDTAGQDKLVCGDSAGNFFVSTVTSADATAGTFALLTSGQSTSAVLLAGAHFDDKYYISNDKDRPYVLSGDRSFRDMGMIEPAAGMICTATTGSYTGRVTTATWTGSEWNNTALGYDTDIDTYAWSRMPAGSASGTEQNVVFSGAASDTSSSRVVIIDWALAGLVLYGDEPQPRRTQDQKEFKVSVVLHVSEDNGSSWTTVNNSTHFTGVAAREVQYPVSANSNLIRVKAQLINNLANNTSPCTLRIHDIRITNEGFIAIFTTTYGGMHYGHSEYDAVNDIESPVIPAQSNPVDMAAQNIVNCAFLGQAAVNANSTHRRVYRTHDGGVPPGDFRLLADVPIAIGTWSDTFSQGPADRGGKVPNLIKVQATDTIPLYFSQDDPPPPFKAIVEYQNFLVSIGSQFPRQLAYSMPGLPESWPLLYRIVNFPLKEHDQLQALAVCGDFLIIAATEALLVANGLPEVDAQNLASADLTAVRGAPGCVGPRAMAEYAINGEPRVMYVSEHGIYETNGHQVRELSSKLDWPATVSQGKLSKTWMFFDRDDQIMHIGLCSDGTGLPNVEYWVHCAPEHQRPDGYPKITGPHHSSKTNEVGALAPDNRYRIYSMDNDTTGTVYHEKDGGTDSGNFFNTSSQISLSLKTARTYGPDLEEWAVDFPTIKHTSWNNTPLVITWSVGRDEIAETDSTTVTLTLSTQGNTKFVVARGGEWHEITFAHTANASTAASIAALVFDPVVLGSTGDTQDS